MTVSRAACGMSAGLRSFTGLFGMDGCFECRLPLPSFEFAESEPKTNRIDDKTSCKDKRHHHFSPPEITAHRVFYDLKDFHRVRCFLFNAVHCERSPEKIINREDSSDATNPLVATGATLSCQVRCPVMFHVSTFRVHRQYPAEPKQRDARGFHSVINCRKGRDSISPATMAKEPRAGADRFISAAPATQSLFVAIAPG